MHGRGVRNYSESRRRLQESPGITVGINKSSRDSGIWNHNLYHNSCKFSTFPYIMNHAMRKPLFGKQESLESIQESWNQAKIPKDSRITSIKIQSCGPLVHGPIKWNGPSVTLILASNRTVWRFCESEKCWS